MQESQRPHSHILMTGGGGGGPSDFLGSEILATDERRRDFLGSQKLRRDFLGLRKKN